MFDNEKIIWTFTACGYMETADSQTPQAEIIDSAEDTETSDKDAPAETEKKEETGKKCLLLILCTVKIWVIPVREVRRRCADILQEQEECTEDACKYHPIHSGSAVPESKYG